MTRRSPLLRGVNVITLTTDFGTRDWFVGTMKGVISRLSPRAAIVDITHGIPPGDVRAGAFALAASCRYFPRGTVHLVVIDPGVGSSRAAIAVRTANYFFVGPDNGVLSFALRKEAIRSVRRIENSACFLRPVSNTFHGRDIFSPVAARLSRGFPMSRLGPEQKSFVRLQWPEPVANRDRIGGEVIYVDRFGNLITNIDSELTRDFDSARIRFRAGGLSFGFATHYQSAPQGKPAAIPGSCGLFEIAINGASAADKLNLRVGDSVEIRCGGGRRFAR